MRQMEGLKFRRQKPIGRYNVDFVCFEKKIIIEVDGGQHAVETRNNTEQDAWLRSQGFNVLKCWNNNTTQGVLPACAVHADREALRIKCVSQYHPPLNPLPSREGIKGRSSHQGMGIYPLEMGRNQ